MKNIKKFKREKYERVEEMVTQMHKNPDLMMDYLHKLDSIREKALLKKSKNRK